MTDETPETRYVVAPEAGAWRVRCGDAGLGQFPTRAAAFAVAVALAEKAAEGGGRAEVICEAP